MDRRRGALAAQSEKGWNRREMLGAAALLAAVIGVPVATVKLSGLDADEAPTDRQRALLREVSQLVLPRTTTPGAGEVGTGDFVALALAHGLEGSRKPLPSDAPAAFLKHRRRDGSINHVGWLEAELDRRAGSDFLSAAPAKRQATLAALDADAYAPDVREHPWRTLKGLILTGYYTSEVGGAQELQFELVPGRFDPDVPVKPGDRAFSSDWTAVDFG